MNEEKEELLMKNRGHIATLKSFKTDDNVGKVGDKVFGVRLPQKYQDYLLNLDGKEKVTLIRTAVMEAIDRELSERN
jgi:hypothetical protein